MNTRTWIHSIAAAAWTLAMNLPAQAAVVDFAGVFDTFGPGQASSSYNDASGFRFTASGGDALIDFSLCSFPDFCSTGNNTEHLQAYGDAVITIDSMAGLPFSLFAFDASFLPSPGINLGGSSIGLRVTGAKLGGGTVSTIVDLVEDTTFGGGDWAFSSYSLGSGFSDLVSVQFQACFFNGQTCGGSVFLNDAQFSLDNINIPEPQSAALGLLALLALAGTRAGRRAR